MSWAVKWYEDPAPRRMVAKLVPYFNCLVVSSASTPAPSTAAATHSTFICQTTYCQACTSFVNKRQMRHRVARDLINEKLSRTYASNAIPGQWLLKLGPEAIGPGQSAWDTGRCNAISRHLIEPSNFPARVHVQSHMYSHSVVHTTRTHSLAY